MKASTIKFFIPLLLGVSTVHAADMFETYPKKYSLGYVSDKVNFRDWLNPTWGVDMSVGFEDNSASFNFNDGVTTAQDRRNFNSYTLEVAAVRSIKSFPYFDLNLKGGASYVNGKDNFNPDGPDNGAILKTNGYSLFFGPEVEIKVPYFSRLVVVSSIQAVYSVQNARLTQETIAGPILTQQKTSDFTLSSDGNSLNEFFHIGVRYYF